MKKEAFKDKTVRDEYEKLAGEYDFIDQLVSMRSKAGLTQDELAKRIGTAKK